MITLFMPKCFRCFFYFLLFQSNVNTSTVFVSSYEPIPIEFNLTNVIVLLRHGDRIQITKDLGEQFKSTKNMTQFWNTKLPKESTLRYLAKADARISTNATLDMLRKQLYSGWDSIHYPYGQLTERGSQQLRKVGRKFWLRYQDFILQDNHRFLSTREALYFRSTNMCRTLLSLRSFLNGFFYNMTAATSHSEQIKITNKALRNKIQKSLSSALSASAAEESLFASFQLIDKLEGDEEFDVFSVSSVRNSYAGSNATHNSSKYIIKSTNNEKKHSHYHPTTTHRSLASSSSSSTLQSPPLIITPQQHIALNQVFSPIIIARPKNYETMYPGICDFLASRRSLLINNRYNNASYIPTYYPSLQTRIHQILKIPQPFNWLTWLNIMEVFICYQTHNVSLPLGLTASDSSLTTQFVSWMWGSLYKDTDLLKYAVGRFFKELYDDARLTVEDIPLPQWRRTSYFYYIGHRRKMIKGETNTHIVTDADSSPAAVAAAAAVAAKEEEEYTIRVLSPPPVPLPSGQTKFIVYSGHDATMVPLLVILGIYNDYWPDYASQLTFEFATAPVMYSPPISSSITTDSTTSDTGTTSATNTGKSSSSSSSSKLKRFKEVIERVAKHIKTTLTNIHSGASEGSIAVVKARKKLNQYRYVRVVYNDMPREIEVCTFALQQYQQLEQKFQNNNNNKGNSHDNNNKSNNEDQPRNSSSSFTTTTSQHHHHPHAKHHHKLYQQTEQLITQYWCPYEVFLMILKMNMISHRDYEKGCKMS